MHYVLMERVEDPQKHDPIYVGGSKDQAYHAREIACEQYAERANKKRIADFNKGYATAGLKKPNEYYHRFSVVSVPETLPTLSS